MKIYNQINENIPKHCAVTVGFFDGVHLGHKFLINELIKTGNKYDCPTLIITMWPHPQTVIYDKKIKLLNDPDEKTDLLRKTGADGLLILDFSHELAGLSPKKFISSVLVNKLNAKILLKGFNNSFGNINKQNEVAENGSIKIINAEKFEFGKHKNINSTLIRNYLSNGKVEQANELLGYNYTIKGKVSSGYKLGRTLGFPTGNLSDINPVKLIPQTGAYIIKAKIGNTYFPAMLNIGYRPSFGSNKKTLEFHILDFDKSIYDQNVELVFYKKIRDEIKFENIDLLVEQLKKDKIFTESYFSENF